jgi:phosphate:Na+ symporter
VEAVRMETQRVYEAALRIIVDGVGLTMDDVLSKKDMAQVVAAKRRVHKFDMDAMYEKRIKGIYSAIVAFISETAFSRRDESSAELQWLREANTRLVEAVKDTALLQENLVHYAGGEDQKMSEVYDRIRSQIALNIRELEGMRALGGGVLEVLQLDALKLLLDEEQNALNQITTELIARRAITPAMGSSLINDSMFAYNIATNLVRAAQTLFAAARPDTSQAVQDVVLDESELDRIVAQAIAGQTGTSNPGEEKTR